MGKRNDGADPIHAVQNRFTAYLCQAVKHQKMNYLRKQHQRQDMEITRTMDALDADACPLTESDMLSGLPPLAQLENQRLLQALAGLTERERYILLAHVLERRGFEELALRLHIGYKGVTSVYYRAIHKIQTAMGGDGA